MSSVAVLTPESFAEHRSGLKDQEITGNNAAGTDFLLDLNTFFLQTFITLRLSACFRPSLSSALVCNLFSSPHLTHVRLWGGRQAASQKMKPTSPPTWRPSLRCRRRGRQGRRRQSRRRHGGARSGPSKRPSSPRSDTDTPSTRCCVTSCEHQHYSWAFTSPGRGGGRGEGWSHHPHPYTPHTLE